VGGRQQDAEPPDACLVRELKEKLRFDPSTGVDYAYLPRQFLDPTDWSTSTWQMTDYRISTFDVQMTRAGQTKIEGHAGNRWVTAPEIRSDRCLDDKLLSPTVRTILIAIGELPP
jgi:hypothetical protein